MKARGTCDPQLFRIRGLAGNGRKNDRFAVPLLSVRNSCPQHGCNGRENKRGDAARAAWFWRKLAYLHRENSSHCRPVTCVSCACANRVSKSLCAKDRR
jgi:hypothetical protein